MAKYRYTRCRHCHRSEEEAGPISARGRCKPCAKARQEANLDAMLDGTGEFAQHHARRLFMGARKRLLKVENAA